MLHRWRKMMRDKTLFFDQETIDKLKGRRDQISRLAPDRLGLSLYFEIAADLLNTIIENASEPAVTHKWVDDHVAPTHRKLREKIVELADENARLWHVMNKHAVKINELESRILGAQQCLELQRKPSRPDDELQEKINQACKHVYQAHSVLEDLLRPMG
jgi:hypothetical protein